MIALFIVWAASCGYAAVIASAKELNVPLWALGGFLFGPIALIAAAGMPDRRQRAFMRHLAEANGWQDTLPMGSLRTRPTTDEELDAQRRRILGR